MAQGQGYKGLPGNRLDPEMEGAVLLQNAHFIFDSKLGRVHQDCQEYYLRNPFSMLAGFRSHFWSTFGHWYKLTLSRPQLTVELVPRLLLIPSQELQPSSKYIGAESSSTPSRTKACSKHIFVVRCRSLNNDAAEAQQQYLTALLRTRSPCFALEKSLTNSF